MQVHTHANLNWLLVSRHPDVISLIDSSSGGIVFQRTAKGLQSIHGIIQILGFLPVAATVLK